MKVMIDWGSVGIPVTEPAPHYLALPGFFYMTVVFRLYDFGIVRVLKIRLKVRSGIFSGYRKSAKPCGGDPRRERFCLL